MIIRSMLRCLAVALLLAWAGAGCETTSGGSAKGTTVKVDPKAWRLANEAYFSMWLPPEMKRKKVETFDSMGGMYKSSNMELHFDAKDALVYDQRQARKRIAALEPLYKPGADIAEGAEGVTVIAGRLAYVQQEQNERWTKVGYPYKNIAQAFIPDPSGGCLAVVVIYKNPEQFDDAVKILKSIGFRKR